MREIKFRLWDDYYKEMNSLDPKSDFDCTRFTLSALNESKYIKPMQYTGLKDKNGVEIYESDLVKTDKGIFQLTIDCFGPELSGYDNGDYYYGDVSEYHNWNEFEVIGNIYENPDLLEEE